MNYATEEPIRKWPVWVARLANRILGWSEDYCTGGCGYPVSGRFNYEVERYGTHRVLMVLCSVGGKCEQEVERDPRDAMGRPYADIRPEFISIFNSDQNEYKVARISFGA